ncbi:Bug family tripartite tricarboxylate transporter substrate binding protein [Lacisediminimonas profundi]|uniref:Bug family tripartite tricarboxylate transporter substrate binding protein n=1 Tax=Lacisediminimonas profundi TaxID=2603856 RepID=UPI00124B313C|nr:tripartite tricarboxylate transporter substrate binding protein [Lacisediminimonas profundi]
MRYPLIPKFVGITLLALSSWTHAQSGSNYPDRPVTIVVPFAAGGASDILSRQLGKQLTLTLGQSFVSDNRVGAGGTVGARTVARAAPNGYTLIMGTNSSHAIAATINKNLGYDPLRNFAPISLVAHVPQILMVNPSLPVTNVKELIAHAKANPGKLNYSSAGNGTPGHLGMELFKIMAGIEMTHVPFQGGGPALLALASGQVHLMADNVSSALPQIKQGKVKAIGVTTSRRSGVLPDLPTIAEQALPGFDSGSWFALFAPADTPKDIISKLNAEIVKALNVPEVRATLMAQGADPKPGAPEELTKLIRDDIDKWSRVVEKIGFKME